MQPWPLGVTLIHRGLPAGASSRYRMIVHKTELIDGLAGKAPVRSSRPSGDRFVVAAGIGGCVCSDRAGRRARSRWPSASSFDGHPVLGRATDSACARRGVRFPGRRCGCYNLLSKRQECDFSGR